LVVLDAVLAVTHRVSAGVALVAAAVAGLGVVMSLVALGLAAVARPRLRDLDGCARERTGLRSGAGILPW
jgi:hypothetical protein